MSDPRRHAPATLRNREPILAVLRSVLPERGRVLEIASGSGEHAVYFAEALAPLIWQPSDPDPANRGSIAAWTAATGIQSVCPPLDLDVTADSWPLPQADAIVCVNMVHIAPWSATIGLFAGAARLLSAGAPLYLYGPFRRNGKHTADSNAAFDAQLRAENAEWGVRELSEVADLAREHGFSEPDVIAMPANNLSLIFRRH